MAPRLFCMPQAQSAHSWLQFAIGAHLLAIDNLFAAIFSCMSVPIQCGQCSAQFIWQHVQLAWGQPARFEAGAMLHHTINMAGSIRRCVCGCRVCAGAQTAFETWDNPEVGATTGRGLTFEQKVAAFKAYPKHPDPRQAARMSKCLDAVSATLSDSL
jgi:hypothetical protein